MKVSLWEPSCWMWDHAVRFDMGHLLTTILSGSALCPYVLYLILMSCLFSVIHLDTVVRLPVDHRMILSDIIQHLNCTCFFLWHCGQTRAMASSFLRFLDHTQRLITVGRTPLDEWSASRRDLYLTTHNTHNRQTSMSPGGIRTHDRSRRAATDLRLRPRGYWDRLWIVLLTYYYFVLISHISKFFILITAFKRFLCFALVDTNPMRISNTAYFCVLKWHDERSVPHMPLQESNVAFVVIRKNVLSKHTLNKD